jgi:hypothetical protein
MEKNKLIALSDRMENQINQGSMHLSGVYCTRSAQSHRCGHATLVQGHRPSGLKPSPERPFEIVIKIISLLRAH